MGVALTSLHRAGGRQADLRVGDDEMEMGVGIHGEPGRRRVKLQPADAIAEEMLGAILGDLGAARGAEVLLLVNGFGGTPLMELYLMYNARAPAARGQAGVEVARSLVGNYVTSLEMAGCSITVTAARRRAERVGRAGAHRRRCAGACDERAWAAAPRGIE